MTAPTRRLVPATATGEMHAACGRLYHQTAIENYGGSPDPEDVFDTMLAASPNAGRGSREDVERVARALVRRQIEVNRRWDTPPA
jgi:hypothetical protein